MIIAQGSDLLLLLHKPTSLFCVFSWKFEEERDTARDKTLQYGITLEKNLVQCLFLIMKFTNVSKKKNTCSSIHLAPK